MSEALLVLEDGTVFRGEALGASVRSHGEVVFSTAMTGYQEALTDPSFAEQVLVMTYPLQGNYGINRDDAQSRRVQVRAFVMREHCDTPSHWLSTQTLHEYLAANGVPGIAGVDTRALTRRLRNAGVMMGTVTHDESADDALARLREVPRYGTTDLVPWVSASDGAFRRRLSTVVFPLPRKPVMMVTGTALSIANSCARLHPIRLPVFRAAAGTGCSAAAPRPRNGAGSRSIHAP